jgi:hypothetical protein
VSSLFLKVFCVSHVSYFFFVFSRVLLVSCIAGQCVCNQGWKGVSCTTQTCPKMCSGHGRCDVGFCHCDAGWSNPDCSVNDCQTGLTVVSVLLCCKAVFSNAINRFMIFDLFHCLFSILSIHQCSGHGTCQSGVCKCAALWKGKFCTEDLCTINGQTCSGRGFCNNGVCKCTANSNLWRGVSFLPFTLLSFFFTSLCYFPVL